MTDKPSFTLSISLTYLNLSKSDVIKIISFNQLTNIPQQNREGYRNRFRSNYFSKLSYNFFIISFTPFLTFHFQIKNIILLK